MAIIQQHSDGLPEPRRGKHQVNGVIAVHIAGFNQQPASRRDKPYELSPGGGALKLDPVGVVALGATASLNRGLIEPLIAIKIRDRNRQPRPSRCGRPTLNSARSRSNPGNHIEKQQRQANKQSAQHPQVVSRVKPQLECARRFGQRVFSRLPVHFATIPSANPPEKRRRLRVLPSVYGSCVALIERHRVWSSFELHSLAPSKRLVVVPRGDHQVVSSRRNAGQDPVAARVRAHR